MAIDSKYNFHSHTYRCGHASEVPDSCYIDEALQQGYTKYGITDHIPVHPLFYSDSSVRMHDSDKGEYLKSIASLKEMYADSINIFSGFEAEYDEIIEKYLCDLRDSCDYMIMGQHYILNKDIRTTPGYPLEYAKKVCAGIESGIFDIVAHPDVFMRYRFGFKAAADLNLFMLNAEIASQMICEKAKEYGVPLELNLGATHVLSPELKKLYDAENDIFKSEQRAKRNERMAQYPTKLFWEISSQVGNDVVVGIDAHFPEEIELREGKLEKIGTYINLDSLNFLPDTYDPVTNRRNNPKLLEAYERTRVNATSVEGRMVESFLQEFLTDEKVRKNKTKTALIRRLRENPPKRKLVESEDSDMYTYQKREELVKVIKGINRGMFGKKRLSKQEYIWNVKRDIDKYYDDEKIITIDSKKKFKL